MEEYRNLLPKNMRQMGEKEDRVRIYVEDYVCTYFQKLELTTECWRVESCWACTKSGREFPAFLFPEQWKPRRRSTRRAV